MVAEISGIGTAMQYFDILSCIVKICLLPSGVVENFPTMSRDTLSKGKGCSTYAYLNSTGKVDRIWKWGCVVTWVIRHYW